MDYKNNEKSQANEVDGGRKWQIKERPSLWSVDRTFKATRDVLNHHKRRAKCDEDTKPELGATIALSNQENVVQKENISF